jgi:phage tail-like protein
MSRGDRPDHASRYLDFLPAVYQEGADVDRPNFLGRFLFGFEHLLTGLDDEERPGLGEILNGVHRYFDPFAAPTEFLDWLAGWVALELRIDLDEGEPEGLDELRRRSITRRFIARAVELYRERGTRAGLTELLRTYTGMGVEIDEFLEPLQVGVTSTVGVDTVIGGGPPHYFRVRLVLGGVDARSLQRREQVARMIIDQEKPAHTFYDLAVDIPETIEVGVRSTVGVDTLIGRPRSSG